MEQPHGLREKPSVAYTQEEWFLRIDIPLVYALNVVFTVFIHNFLDDGRTRDYGLIPARELLQSWLFLSIVLFIGIGCVSVFLKFNRGQSPLSYQSQFTPFYVLLLLAPPVMYVVILLLHPDFPSRNGELLMFTFWALPFIGLAKTVGRVTTNYQKLERVRWQYVILDIGVVVFSLLGVLLYSQFLAVQTLYVMSPNLREIFPTIKAATGNYQFVFLSLIAGLSALFLSFVSTIVILWPIFKYFRKG